MNLKHEVKKIKRKVNTFFGKKKTDLEIWWSRNKEWAIVAVPIAASAAHTGVKYILKMAVIRREERTKFRSIWDGRQRFELKRKPTNRQRLEIDRRHQKGERIADILDSMRLI